MKPSETPVPLLDEKSGTSEQPSSKLSHPNKPWLWALLVLSIIASGIALWRVFSSSSRATQPVAARQGSLPRPVETVSLTAGTAARRVQLIGQVESSQRATIRARTSGVIQEVLVQPGDRVTPGMTIAILDDADQQLTVSEAQAQLAQERSNLARLEVGTRREIVAQRQAAVRSARAREQEALDNLRRTTDLVAQGALSQRLQVEAQATVDDARGERLEAEAALAEAQAGPTREEIDAQRANVEAARAALNQARLALQRTRITALSGGVVQQRRLSPGDLVQAGGEIVTLVAGDNLDVFLEIPEELSGGITSGLPVELIARALPRWRERATITGVVPVADAASRRQRVRIRLDNPPPGLLSGMAVTGRLELPSNQPSFVVSRDALTRRQNQWLVFTVANGRARQLEVELVADMGEKVAIYNQQLRAGQPVVLRGGDGLQNGAAVKVVEQ